MCEPGPPPRPALPTLAGPGAWYRYRSDLFSGAGGTEPRTVHLGVDLFRPAGSPVFAPLRGRVHSLANNTTPGDYGPCVVLVHELDVRGRCLWNTRIVECIFEGCRNVRLRSPTDACVCVRRVWSFSRSTGTWDARCCSASGRVSGGELRAGASAHGRRVCACVCVWLCVCCVAARSCERADAGDEIAHGGLVGYLGDASVNGGWPPHVHFQARPRALRRLCGRAINHSLPIDCGSHGRLEG